MIFKSSFDRWRIVLVGCPSLPDFWEPNGRRVGGRAALGFIYLPYLHGKNRANFAEPGLRLFLTGEKTGLPAVCFT